LHLLRIAITIYNPFKALATMELNSYIAILDMSKHKKTPCSSGAIAKFFS